MNHDKDPYEPTSTNEMSFSWGFWALHVERNQFVPDDYHLASRVGGLQFRLRYWTFQGACQTHAGLGWIGRKEEGFGRMSFETDIQIDIFQPSEVCIKSRIMQDFQESGKKSDFGMSKGKNPLL